MNNIMNDIANFYFDGGGWIIATGIGFAVGWLCGFRAAVAWIAVILPFTSVLMWYHHAP